MPALSSARRTTPAASDKKPAAAKAAAPKSAAAAAKPPKPERPTPEQLTEILRTVLDDAKAEDIVVLDLAGKTSLADSMIIATGTSDRHVNALAERVMGKLRELRFKPPRVEGMPVCDWVLMDTGDILLHLFRPEVRGFYNLEKLWGMSRPLEGEAEIEEKPAKPARPRTIRTKAE
jgi:ribosome-associated protein